MSVWVVAILYSSEISARDIDATMFWQSLQ